MRPSACEAGAAGSARSRCRPGSRSNGTQTMLLPKPMPSLAPMRGVENGSLVELPRSERWATRCRRCRRMKPPPGARQGQGNGSVASLPYCARIRPAFVLSCPYWACPPRPRFSIPTICAPPNSWPASAASVDALLSSARPRRTCRSAEVSAHARGHPRCVGDVRREGRRSRWACRMARRAASRSPKSIGCPISSRSTCARSPASSPGDRIAIQMPNCLAYPVAVFGTLKAGLVMVNTNPLYTTAGDGAPVHRQRRGRTDRHRSVRHQSRRGAAEDRRSAPWSWSSISDLLPPLKRLLVRVGAEVREEDDPADSPSRTRPCAGRCRDGADRIAAGADPRVYAQSLDHDSIAALQYTGGTTGVAKGAVLTHGNLRGQHRCRASRCGSRCCASARK